MELNSTQTRHYHSAIDKVLSAGERMTPVRDKVLKLLCRCEGHPGSREIIRGLEEEYGSIARASVFRTLELFVRLCIIRPTFVEGGAPGYVLLAGEGHHAHIICPECGSVQEIHDCKLTGLIDELSSEYKRPFSGHLLELYGICPECTEEQN